MAKTKRIGRPPVEIDLRQLEALAAIQATYEEAAAVLGCTKRTLIKKLKKKECLEAYENGKLKGRLNLRRLQWKHANGEGSSAVNMTIHLSKHWLGEIDKPGAVVETHNTLAVNVEGSGARERITAKLTALSERIESRVVELAAESGASLVPREPIAGRD